jgi:hypothetical protein
MAKWEAQFGEWQRFRRDSADFMLTGVVPHTRALLANYLFVGVCVFVSCALDVLIFLGARDVPSLRQASTATLAAIAAPFIESIGRYVTGLAVEFTTEERHFRKQREEESR